MFHHPPPTLRESQKWHMGLHICCQINTKIFKTFGAEVRSKGVIFHQESPKAAVIWLFAYNPFINIVEIMV